MGTCLLDQPHNVQDQIVPIAGKSPTDPPHLRLFPENGSTQGPLCHGGTGTGVLRDTRPNQAQRIQVTKSGGVLSYKLQLIHVSISSEISQHPERYCWVTDEDKSILGPQTWLLLLIWGLSNGQGDCLTCPRQALWFLKAVGSKDHYLLPVLGTNCQGQSKP